MFVNFLHSEPDCGALSELCAMKVNVGEQLLNQSCELVFVWKQCVYCAVTCRYSSSGGAAHQNGPECSLSVTTPDAQKTVENLTVGFRNFSQ